ncbi:transposase [Escherichia coli]|nr:transposase [Escherichia coli]
MPGNSPHYGRWPQHDFTSLKKLRPQSVTSRIQPGSDVIVCAEMDEQWGYVGAKSRQRWLFYAYDRLRKTVVAHVFGERTMATLGRLMSLLSPFDVVIWMTDGWPLYESRLKGKLHVISKRYTQRIERHNLNLRQHLALGRLMSLLSPFDVVIWMTDGWPLYESRLKGKLHVISKRYTQRIERHNLNLRQHLARLGRKSLSFSKSVELHDKVIGHYLNIKHYQ